MTTTELETPRTDANLQSTKDTSALYVFADFARELELEIAELREALRLMLSLYRAKMPLSNELEKLATELCTKPR